MNAVVPASAFALDDLSEFFAPVNHNELDELLQRRDATKLSIQQMAAAVLADRHGAMGRFIEANLDRDTHVSPDRLFDAGRAIKQLDSDMWHRAMRLTDVWEYMPQARRDQWNKQLRAWKDERDYKEGAKPELDMLPFEREVVIGTIKSLLGMRTQFFSEKVDGIFRGLSGEHVTNSPMGFGKRMIISNAAAYGKAGLIDDLRNVIAKFRGLEEKVAISSSDMMRKLPKSGEWFDVDGGAMRIRLYQVGTAHLEVHEELAWKLNKVLAMLHPLAIPSEFRQRPKKRKVKDFDLFDDLVPGAVRSLIGGMRAFNGRSFYFDHYHHVDKAVISTAEAVLRAIGGVQVEREYKADRWGHDVRKRKVWEFDYTPDDVLNVISITGRVPNAKSYQFYPTPEGLAAKAVELAQIGPDDTCLEPSAGQGSLADLMPKDRTQCVEISKLHCDILQAKGHVVSLGDFLNMPTATKFDRVVMNPPFSEGRWQAHLEHAAKMVKPGGRLVAILPSGALNKPVLQDGWALTWSKVYDNEFAGASVSVVILSAERK